MHNTLNSVLEHSTYTKEIFEQKIYNPKNKILFQILFTISYPYKCQTESNTPQIANPLANQERMPKCNRS